MLRCFSTPIPPSANGDPSRTNFSIVTRPDSLPIGLALLKHNFIPLYSAGLWLAVNIAPGNPNFPDAKYSMSVEANPIRMTSIPNEVAPAENASANNGDEGRMSSPITIVPGSLSICRNRAKATPVANAKSASISTSTKPRIS